MSPSDSSGESDGHALECRACGSKIWGVTENDAKVIMAKHLLEEHGDEAPEAVKEEARELINS